MSLLDILRALDVDAMDESPISNIFNGEYYNSQERFEQLLKESLECNKYSIEDEQDDENIDDNE